MVGDYEGCLGCDAQLKEVIKISTRTRPSGQNNSRPPPPNPPRNPRPSPPRDNRPKPRKRNSDHFNDDNGGANGPGGGALQLGLILWKRVKIFSRSQRLSTADKNCKKKTGLYNALLSSDFFFKPSLFKIKWFSVARQKYRLKTPIIKNLRF